MKIPPHVSFDEAATIAVRALTSGQELFQEMKLRLPPPIGESPMLNESILIYGGSSSAGMLAIQRSSTANCESTFPCKDSH